MDLPIFYNCGRISTYSHQLNLEYQGGAARDARLGELPIAHLGRDVNLPFVTDVHVLHGDDPPPR